MFAQNLTEALKWDEIAQKKREFIDTLKIIGFWFYLLIMLMVIEQFQKNTFDLITNISVQIVIMFILFYYITKGFYQICLIWKIQSD
jgi:hypothetical protein